MSIPQIELTADTALGPSAQRLYMRPGRTIYETQVESIVPQELLIQERVTGVVI